MRISRIVLFAVFGLCFALPATAQYIGVLQSAETMIQGTYKLMIAPIMIMGKDGADNEIGVGIRGGYAFTEYFDAEAKLGFFDNGTFVGVDGEYWIFKGKEQNSKFDLSLTGGIHWMLGSNKNYDTMGFEITPQLSGHASENLELCLALDASFESFKDAPKEVDNTYTRLHIVPGIEYRLSKTFDLEVEYGIDINDNSANYLGAGITYYLR